MEAKDKNKAFEDALKQVTKMYGAGAAMKLGEAPSVNVSAISTGSMLVDECFGFFNEVSVLKNLNEIRNFGVVDTF